MNDEVIFNVKPVVRRCNRGHEFTDPSAPSTLFMPSKREFCIRCAEELLIKWGCGEFSIDSVSVRERVWWRVVLSWIGIGDGLGPELIEQSPDLSEWTKEQAE